MRTVLGVLDGFVALTALAGGAALMADPSGGILVLSPALLAHSPFANYFVPGVILAGAVGGSAAVAAAAHFRRAPQAHLWSLVAGLVLLGWLSGQVALLRVLAWQQGFMLGIGLLQVGLAWVGWPAARVDGAVGSFLGHRRIAFVGLSTDEKDFSRYVARALTDHGYTVVPVHPGVDTIDGQACWPRVSAIPDPPGAVLLMVPPAAARGVVDDCVTAGVEAVWFHRGVGPGSASESALQRATEAGMTVVSDTCPMMHLAPVGGVHRLHRWMRSPV